MSINNGNSKTDSSSMIHHTVAFKLKHDKGSDKESIFLKTCVDMLSDIKGMLNFALKKQISKNNPYDFELEMDFNAAGDYESYNSHEKHQKFVHDIFLKQVDEFLEKDTTPVLKMDTTKVEISAIKHSVAFKLKWDKGSKEETLFLKKSFDLLSDISTVKNFKVNRQINTNNPYEFELSMDFVSKEDYDYYNTAGSMAKAFEQIEYSVSVVRAIYMRDVLLRPYLGRVIVRAILAHDPYTGLTQGDYLSAVRLEWNNNHASASTDVVAGVSPSKIGGGLAWVGVVGTSSKYSVSQGNSDGRFDVV